MFPKSESKGFDYKRLPYVRSNISVIFKGFDHAYGLNVLVLIIYLKINRQQNCTYSCLLGL